MESPIKEDIRALSLEQLESYFKSIGEKSFRAKQAYKWIWQKSVVSFSEMTNLSKTIREDLDKNFKINNALVNFHKRSKDGTIKNSIKLHDGLFIESVLIPTKSRITVCVSSQVGCSLNCKFCATSLLKRMRNLSADEIYDQVVLMNKQSIAYYKKSLTNIVFMGMGEPLMNYKNVIMAINKITQSEGLAMSAKRITLSTSGIPKMIKKMADDNVKFGLAVSLHSASQSIREKIMPFSKNFPLNELKDSLEYWYKKTKLPVTLEYIVWKGINDDKDDILSLISFCNKIPSKVNLIEYNAIGNPNFVQALNSKIMEYKNELEKANITVTVRSSRGKDINAACGQLANKSN
tara:strand:- start:3626 stop:4672 length:1047 start_codon:yes stop_codon:yes gene_type:complete